MIIVFCILCVFFIVIAVFMFHEIFIVKKNIEQGKMIVTIDEWDEDLLENFIRHIKKFGRYINVKIYVQRKKGDEKFQELLSEKYDIDITD